MSKIIAFSNHKGGVGKTTSVINIGAALNKQGYRALLIDMDAQANLSHSLGIVEPVKNTYGVMRGLYELSESIIKVKDGLDVLPSILDLSGAEIELSSETGREYILKDALEPVINNYDFILIDCPPSLSLLTINALTVADEIYIPLQAQYLALQGLTKLMEIMLKIKKRLNNKLEIGGVFITQYDKRIILNRDVANVMAEHFKDRLFNTKIRVNIALAEAPAEKKDIFEYSPASNGAEDYLALSKEIISKHQNKTNNG